MGWAIWWLFLLGIAFQEIVDIALWGWLVVLSLVLRRAVRINRENKVTSMLSFAAIAACAILAWGTPTADISMLRSLWPRRSPIIGHPHWQSIEFAVLLFMTGASYVRFFKTKDSKWPWTTFISVMAPIATASILMSWKPSAGVWDWMPCFLSLGLLVVLRPAPEIRGIWLSAIALAYYRTMADDNQWCFLALACAAGWCLAWKSRDGHPLLEGLGLLGVGIWSYKLTGGYLTFSHISIAEGYRILGESWHPYVLWLILILKYFCALCAPILPWLASRPLNSVLAIIPLLGSLATGNLAMLWGDRFMLGGTERLTDHVGFARAVFALIFSWMLIAVWTAIRGIGRISERLDTESNPLSLLPRSVP